MSIGKKKQTKSIFVGIFLCFSLICVLSISSVSLVFAQTDNVNTDSEKSSYNGNNANGLEKRIVIKPVNLEIMNSDQENIGREAMTMIIEISKSNVLYEKNKSAANLAFKEQKFKDREMHNKEMKEYNDKYNKKYLASFKRYQKMRGQHAAYSGVHSDYSAYLQQFLSSTSR